MEFDETLAKTIKRKIYDIFDVKIDFDSMRNIFLIKRPIFSVYIVFSLFNCITSLWAFSVDAKINLEQNR